MVMVVIFMMIGVDLDKDTNNEFNNDNETMTIAVTMITMKQRNSRDGNKSDTSNDTIANDNGLVPAMVIKLG